MHHVVELFSFNFKGTSDHQPFPNVTFSEQKLILELRDNVEIIFFYTKINFFEE